MIVEHLAAVTIPRLRVLSEQMPVRAAARLFSRAPIGLIVICDGAGRTSGVVSKSDLVGHLDRSGSGTSAVAEVMTHEVVECLAADLLHNAWETMRSRQLQNMPVVDNHRRPVGVLDIRDALQAILAEEQDQERLLIDYIAGVGYR